MNMARPLPSSSRRTLSCVKTVLAVACLCPATPQLCLGQAVETLRGLIPTGSALGIDLEYGVLLPGSVALYHRTATGAPKSWARLRLAASPMGRMRAELATADQELFPGASAALRASTTTFAGRRVARMVAPLDAKQHNFNRWEVEFSRYLIEPTVTLASANQWAVVELGPVFKYTTSEIDDDVLDSRATGTYGVGRFLQLGGRISTALSLTSQQQGGTHSLSVDLGGAAYPALLDVASPFAEVHGEVSGTAALPLPTMPTLTLRAGGKKLWGAVPFQEAAFLGGSNSLRSLPSRSLAGDAAVYGGAELHVALGNTSVFGRSATYGVMGIADAGRMYYDGVAGCWLYDVGGGVWVRPTEAGRRFGVGLASGPAGTRVFLQISKGQ